MRSSSRLVVVMFVVLGCGVLASCSKSGSGDARPVVAPAAHVVLRVGATVTQPAVLIDDHGRTLYASRQESAKQPTCAGQCLQVWPLVLLRRGGSVGAGADAVAQSAITTVASPEGEAVAYHGHLLHTYVGDPSPGDSAGQGVDGVWSVVTPAGRLPG